MPEWILLGLAGIGLFATIAAVTPNKTDNKVAQFFLDTVNAIGMNIGKAENHPGGAAHPDNK
jgi:hypothetical protein